MLDDAGLVWDLRKKSGQLKGPRFNPFRDKLQRMLSEMSAVHERQQNEVGYHAHFV